MSVVSEYLEKQKALKEARITHEMVADAEEEYYSSGSIRLEVLDNGSLGIYRQYGDHVVIPNSNVLELANWIKKVYEGE